MAAWVTAFRQEIQYNDLTWYCDIETHYPDEGTGEMKFKAIYGDVGHRHLLYAMKAHVKACGNINFTYAGVKLVQEGEQSYL